MKRFLSIAAAVCMVFSFAACSSTTGGEPATEAETQAELETETEENNTQTDDASLDGEVITIGLDENFPPMGFKDENGEITGFDIDMAIAAAEKMGAAVEFQPIDWASKELELNADKVDLLWNGLTITDERKETMLFTKPYLANRQIILVKSDSGIAAKADLSGKNVGLQKESSAVEAVNADAIAPELTLNEYPDNISAFIDLDIGRLDAVVVDEIVARYYLAQNDTDFIILEENFGDEEYGIAAKLGNEALVEKLQAALDEMNADGTAAEISKKWFGEDIVLK